MRHLALLAVLTGCAGALDISDDGEAIHVSCPVGSDLSAVINAADVKLGASRKAIRVAGGGTLISQVTLSHRLHFDGDTYDPQASPGVAQILAFAGAEIEGDGDVTGILEPPSFVFIRSGESAQDPDGPGTPGLVIRNFQLIGRNQPRYPGYESDIALGNSTDFLVEGLHFNGVQGNPIEAGESSAHGNHGSGTVRGCTCDDIPTSAIAVVNADVLAEGNTFNRGWLPIDVEPNLPACADIGLTPPSPYCSPDGDWGRLTARNNVGLGVAVQGAVSGPVLIEHNSGFGVGVYNAHDVQVIDNQWTRPNDPYNMALLFAGAVRARAIGNTITNSGGTNGGAPAVLVTTDVNPDGSCHPTTGLVFENNTVTAPVRGSGIVRESPRDGHAGDPTCALPDGNLYRDNTLGPGSDGMGHTEPAAVLLIGPASSQAGNRFLVQP